jgi:hypothetical protein
VRGITSLDLGERREGGFDGRNDAGSKGGEDWGRSPKEVEYPWCKHGGVLYRAAGDASEL